VAWLPVRFLLVSEPEDSLCFRCVDPRERGSDLRPLCGGELTICAPEQTSASVPAVCNARREDHTPVRPHRGHVGALDAPALVAQDVVAEDESAGLALNPAMPAVVPAGDRRLLAAAAVTPPEWDRAVGVGAAGRPALADLHRRVLHRLAGRPWRDAEFPDASSNGVRAAADFEADPLGVEALGEVEPFDLRDVDVNASAHALSTLETWSDSQNAVRASPACKSQGAVTHRPPD